MVFTSYAKKSGLLCASAILALSLLVSGPNSAFAVPTLQLGIPGADYIESGTVDVNGTTVTLTQSLFTTDNPFTLQVLGATTPTGVIRIESVRLFVSFEKNDFLANQDTGTVTVTNVTDPGNPMVISPTGGIQFGIPIELEPHGIFPTYYFVYDLPDLDAASEAFAIPDTQTGELGNARGDILSLSVAYSGFFYLHMDAAGVAVKSNGRTFSVKAPYSHDADAPPPPTPPGGPPPVSEPSSLAITGLGILFVGLISRKRRSRKE